MLPTRFQVLVRIRPLIPEDQENSPPLLIADTRHNSISLAKDGLIRFFTFDRVFDHSSTQQQVFECLKLGSQVLQGFNSTLFAYGQTGSGKTHTILGPKFGYESQRKESGMAVKVCMDLFERIQKKLSSTQFLIKLSIYQIYMQNIYDLLGDCLTPLNIRQDPKEGIFIEGLTTQSVTSIKQLLDILRPNIKKRMAGATLMNRNSSRSHIVVELSVEQRWVQQNSAGRQYHRKGILRIVDLAGSQRLSKTSSQGLRMDEAKNINRSIAALSNCINALSTLAQQQRKKKGDSAIQKSLLTNFHVPFRQSKLTRVLSESLSGESKVTICACVSPIGSSLDQTYSTLLFAMRAMQIKVSPKQNIEVYYKVQQNRSVSPLLKKPLVSASINNLSPIRQDSRKDTSIRSKTICEQQSDILRNFGGSQVSVEGDIQKYRSIINHLIDQLVQKNSKIIQLQRRLSKYQ